MSHQVYIQRLNEVKPQPVKWLWPGRIAVGKVTLIAGDPGLGKSFITLDIAARLSRGLIWPDGPTSAAGAGGLGKPAGTLVCSAEDDPGDTIRPRIEAAGGDPSRIGFVSGVDRPGSSGMRPLSLDADCAALRAAISNSNDCRLVIVDPISAFMGDADSHNNAQVRAVLSALSTVARQTGVAVLAVTHLAKSGGADKTKAVYRAMGSLAFTAAARCVWQVGVHPDDPKGRIMALVKTNLGGVGGPIGFRITDGKVAWEQAPADFTADALEDRELGDEQRGIGEAARFLREFLADGARPASEVIAGASQAGIADRTLRRARGAAQVETGRAPGSDPARPWVWSIKPVKP